MHSKKIRTTAIISFAAALLLLGVPFATVAAVPQGAAAPNTPAPPDPPLNSTPYYAASGDLVYSAAGAAMRNQGYGNITVNWTGTLVKAFLIWDYINPTNVELNTGALNGNPITGTLQGTDASPCWGNGNIYVYAADVTSIVNNGINNLTHFPSGLTTGESPWDFNTVAPLDEGASLVVVSQTGSVAQQVYIYTGAYTSIGNTLFSTFDHGAADGTAATTTFIVADGQVPGNIAGWNNVTVDSNAFPGSDPKTSTQAWSFGSLWDTKTYSVPVTLGATSDGAEVTGTDDCVTWSGQVLAIPTSVSITTTSTSSSSTSSSSTSTTTTTTTSINGVPQFGAPTMVIAAIGMVLMALLVKRKSALHLHIPTSV
jgi:hypothetical protein